MKLSELFRDEWFVGPSDMEGAADLANVLSRILERAAADGVVEADAARSLPDDVVEGRVGEVIRLADTAVAVLVHLEGCEAVSMGVAVADEPFVVEADHVEGAARVVLLFLCPGKVAGPRQQIVPAVTRALKDSGRAQRLAAVTSAEELRGMKELMETTFQARSLVEDALLPVRYRVYPDTPVSEVLDLMVRRGIRAVPVVGERYEVLGILTSGDALQHLLRKGRPDGKEGTDGSKKATTVARDLMSRSVLCVSEDQVLSEAANMMVNRNVEQLPVVREGELIGFITRDSILRVLYGPPEDQPTEEESDDDS